MDNSRALQLAKFRREMRDVSRPFAPRARAARAYYRVKRQLKDRKLIKLRGEYMRADAAGDDAARESIASRMDEHMLRTYRRRI